MRTNLLIAAVIILGFGVMEISTNCAFRRLFVQDIEYVSKLTSENMYMGIKERMGQPIHVSFAQSPVYRICAEPEAQSQNRPYRMSVAFGYAFYDEAATPPPPCIFSAADKKMYEDKSRCKRKWNSENDIK